MMEKSLNSTRNFKLPPIQGALPTTNSLQQPSIPKPFGSWPKSDNQPLPGSLPRNRLTVKTREVNGGTSDSFTNKYRNPQIKSNFANSAVQRQILGKTNESENNRKLTLDFTPLVHQFPRTFDILPPIHRGPQSIVGKPGFAQAHNDFHNKGKKDSVNKLIDIDENQGDKQKLDDAVQKHDQKTVDKAADSGLEISNSNCKKRQRYEDEQINKEICERKKSTTIVLFSKGKRWGRRFAVCLENEADLINVAEQLKEIFLRKNMEEMYLI